MDTLADVLPAIPVRLFGAGGGDVVAGLVVLALLVLVLAGIVMFARSPGSHRPVH